MLNLVVAAVAMLVFLGLGIGRKKPSGLLGIVFFMPFAERYVTGAGLKTSILSIAIVSYFLGRLVSGKLSLKSLRPMPFKVHVFILSAYILASFFFASADKIPANIHYFGNFLQNVSIYVSVTIAGVLLALLVHAELDTEQKARSCIRAFLWSGVYLGVTYFITGIARIPLPEFISPVWILKGAENQVGMLNRVYDLRMGNLGFIFTGFIGFIENFAEYLFTLLALAVTLFVGRRRTKSDILLIVVSILLSVLFSFTAAVKAYPIMVALFLIPMILLGTKGRIRLGLTFAVAASVLLLFLIQGSLKSTFYFQRFSVASERIEQAKKVSTPMERLAKVMGREDIVPYFGRVAETGGLTGIGPLVVHSIGSSVIPYHNLYYSLWLSFGIVGLVLYVSLFLRSGIRSWRARGLSPALKGPNTALALIMAVLLIEQMKVSSFRISYGVIAFWFALGLSSTFARLAVQQRNAAKDARTVVPDNAEGRSFNPRIRSGSQS